ncbi:MAG: PTS sugar transporter subunit IIB [Turicibacter sp.]|nr:PTS sugar transporter subunit IIB [Turicibacter sp.]
MSRKLKIITACGFGLGSSMLLKMKVEEVLKKHSIDAKVETSDVGSAPSAACDVIFTSYELGEKMKSQTETPIVMVRNFMDTDEIESAGLGVVKGLLE